MAERGAGAVAKPGVKLHWPERGAVAKPGVELHWPGRGAVAKPGVKLHWPGRGAVAKPGVKLHWPGGAVAKPNAQTGTRPYYSSDAKSNSKCHKLAFSEPDGYGHTHGHAEHDGCSDGVAEPDGYGHTHGHAEHDGCGDGVAEPDGYGHTHGHAEHDGCSDGVAEPDGLADSVIDADAVPVTHADRHIHSHGFPHPDGHIDDDIVSKHASHPLGDADTDAYGQADASSAAAANHGFCGVFSQRGQRDADNRPAD